MADHENEATSVSELEEHPGPSPLSILDVLKAPMHMELTRKRKIDCNPPPKGKRRAQGEGSSEPKTVSSCQRVDRFPDHAVFGSDRVGRVKAFLQRLLRRTYFTAKHSFVANHVASNKHKSSKEKLALRDEQRER